MERLSLKVDFWVCHDFSRDRDRERRFFYGKPKGK